MLKLLGSILFGSVVAHATLDIMMFYECYPTEQYKWANWCQTSSIDDILTGKKLGMNGFYRMGSGIWCKEQHDLCPGWEQTWEGILAEIKPHLPKFPGDDKAPVQGIFLGDEYACHHSIPLDVFEVAANRIRQDVDAATNGKATLFYENECSDTMTNWTHVPTALDLFSIDHYNWEDMKGSANESIQIYEKTIFPKMAPHQRAIFVPGTFADVRKPVAPQDETIKEMLEIFVGYAKAHDDVMAGFNPWHFATRINDTHLYKTEWYGMEQLPSAYAYMQEVGKEISGK